MSKITPQSYRVLIKVFQRAGFLVKRVKGSHIIMNKPGVERPLVIPKYNEVDVEIIK
ncbi:MAG: type II toxin-antitoxin system HicA family toxin [Candidatus Aminicenantales bacterium]